MMTQDLGHVNIRAPKGRALTFVKVAQGRVGHVYIGDNNGQEDEHIPVGAGQADLVGGG